VGGELFHVDRQTDITKLIALFAILRKRLKCTVMAFFFKGEY